jgi:replicative DNA helicase
MLKHAYADDPSDDNSDACERALIGCLLQDPRLVNFAPGVNSKSFNQEACARAWDAITEMIEEKRYVNFRTVAAYTGMHVHVLSGFTDVEQCCADEEETREYARIVAEAALVRRLRERGGGKR